MSGIAGILNLDGGPVDPAQLERMARALAHRGPDGWRCWNEGPVGLVHLQLAIDPELPQPLVREGRALTLDGRIDNLRTLTRLIRRKTKREGADGENSPEVLLAAYRLWGGSTPRVLFGDFAFALWDADEQRLILARDPLGLKPLFYFQDERRLIFASECKAILAVPGVPCEPDEIRLRTFERLRFPWTQRTFFQGIHRLLPGEFLQVTDGEIRSGFFYRFNPNKRIRMPSRNAYRRRFHKLFLEAVRCRLPQSGNVVVRLSGGLDSSAVAGAAVQIQKSERPGLRLLALSLVSRDFPDERQYCSAVCQEKGLEQFFLFVEEVDVLKGLNHLVYHCESPFFDATDQLILEGYKAARKSGARVTLGGEWGDQVLTSVSYLGDMVRQGKLAQLAREFTELQKLPQQSGGTPWDLFKSAVRYLLLPNGFSDKFQGFRYLLGRDPQNSHPRFPTANQRELYDGVMLNFEFREALDKMAALSGLDLRLPFLDRRLIEFLLAVPVEERVREGLGKRLLRESLSGILPDIIAQRRDKGDWTDWEFAMLRKAGVKGDSYDQANQNWLRKMRGVWEEVWIQKNDKAIEEKKLISSLT